MIEDVLINGTELVLDRAFRSIGFVRIKDAVLRALVISRLSFPSSKTATAEYLKAYYDEDVSLDGESRRISASASSHLRCTRD